MQPRIDRTQFGSITIDGKVFEHDVLIRLGGQVEKRKKKLSKAVYAPRTPSRWPRPSMSTRRGRAPAHGAGQYSRVALSEEAASYFQRHRCQVELPPTPAVIAVWNQAEGAVIAMLHVTC